MKIAFLFNCFCTRGTETNIWSYAYYNKLLLNNESIIICRKRFNNMTGADFTNDAKLRFTNEFDVYELEDDEIDAKLIELNIDVCKFICVGGNPLDFCPKSVPTISSCIFNANYPIGTIHTALSPYLANNNCISLPFMINIASIEDTMRNELDIPNDALVFGRYGGYEQFNIDMVKNVVINVALKNPQIYFIFMNTKPFTNDIKNIKYLDNTVCNITKRKFINTCDAMLHARLEGETFGLACGEFAIAGKPIITCNSGDYAHLAILKDKAIIYDNAERLTMILENFKKIKIDMSNNGYYEYLPEKVIKTFEEILYKAKEKFIKST